MSTRTAHFKRRWNNGLWLLVIALGLWLVSPVIYPTLGRIEGRVFPVMSRISLTNPTPQPPPQWRYNWHGAALKYRDCSYVRTIWYYGDRNGLRVPVAMVYTDPPQIRESGEQIWGGILIDLDMNDVLQNSHADVVHSCPWSPWPVVTEFYR